MTDFWAGRRVLVTGHTGFKGGWLALWLRELGATVTGFGDPPPTDPALFELARVAELASRTCAATCARPAAVGAAVEAARPDVVLHLAAQPLVRRAWREPVDAFAVNALGTAHVLEAVRRRAPEAAVVVVTTDKVYADPDSGRRFARGRPARRQGPLLRVQGRGRAGRGGVPRLLRPAGRDGPRRQRDRRRRLGRGPHPPRRRPRRARRAGRSSSATRPRSARGSTSSTRCAATCCSPSAWPGRRTTRGPGTSRRRWSTSSARSGGSSSASRAALGGLDGRRRPSSATARSRRPGSASIRRSPPRRSGWRERWALERGVAADRGVVPAGGVRGRRRAGGDAGAAARLRAARSAANVNGGWVGRRGRPSPAQRDWIVSLAQTRGAVDCSG